MRKRALNVKLLVGLLVGVAVAVVAIFFFHRVQVDRNADELLKMAQEARAGGDYSGAIRLLRNYVALRPDDYPSYITLGETAVELAESPEASRRDIYFAYQMLGTAVRKIPVESDGRRSPEHVKARRLAAEFMVKIGQFGDAMNHLEFLLHKRFHFTNGHLEEIATGDIKKTLALLAPAFEEEEKLPGLGAEHHGADNSSKNNGQSCN